MPEYQIVVAIEVLDEDGDPQPDFLASETLGPFQSIDDAMEASLRMRLAEGAYLAYKGG